MYVCTILYIEHIPKHVSFAEKNYKVNESDGSVFITLVLDIPSSSDIPVEVWEHGESASHKGEYMYVGNLIDTYFQ